MKSTEYNQMNYLLGTLLFLFTVSSAVAEQWTQIDVNDGVESNPNYTLYADLDTVMQANGEAKMWTLIDYTTEQEAAGALYLSKMVRYEYDCNGRHFRVLAYKLFSWNMGQGELIRAYNQPQQWEKIEPDSRVESEWRIACST